MQTCVGGGGRATFDLGPRTSGRARGGPKPEARGHDATIPRSCPLQKNRRAARRNPEVVDQLARGTSRAAPPGSAATQRPGGAADNSARLLIYYFRISSRGATIFLEWARSRYRCIMASGFRLRASPGPTRGPRPKVEGRAAATTDARLDTVAARGRARSHVGTMGARFPRGDKPRVHKWSSAIEIKTVH